MAASVQRLGHRQEVPHPPIQRLCERELRRSPHCFGKSTRHPLHHGPTHHNRRSYADAVCNANWIVAISNILVLSCTKLAPKYPANPPCQHFPTCMLCGMFGRHQIHKRCANTANEEIRPRIRDSSYISSVLPCQVGWRRLIARKRAPLRVAEARWSTPFPLYNVRSKIGTGVAMRCGRKQSTRFSSDNLSS